VCGDGRVDGVGVDSFDATGRSDGAWAAPDAIDATAPQVDAAGRSTREERKGTPRTAP